MDIEKRIIVSPAIQVSSYRMNRVVAEVDKTQVLDEGGFVESNIGFNASVLEAALKDTECPVSVGELLDYAHDALHDQLQLTDADEQLQDWINLIMDEIQPAPADGVK